MNKTQQMTNQIDSLLKATKRQKLSNIYNYKESKSKQIPINDYWTYCNAQKAHQNRGYTELELKRHKSNASKFNLSKNLHEVVKTSRGILLTNQLTTTTLVHFTFSCNQLLKTWASIFFPLLIYANCNASVKERAKGKRNHLYGYIYTVLYTIF